MLTPNLRRLHTSLRQIIPVNIDYNQLLAEQDLSQIINQGFGKDSFGILTVSNVPNFKELRSSLLPLGWRVANLHPNEQRLLEDPQSSYSVGWSHGKEMFLGQPDTAKGSYYNHPLTEDPIQRETHTVKNIWPAQQIPEFESKFKEMARLIQYTGLLLAKHIDKFINANIATYPGNEIQNIISKGKYHCGRLLHYFPSKNQQEGNWCGWHNDHCALTGLVPGMLADAETGEIYDNSQYEDNKTGLFFITRSQEKVKGVIQPSQLAFQIGEVSQILSGGVLQATPHAVMNSGRYNHISRQSFALFMEPWPEFVLKCYGNQDEIYNDNPSVPSIRGRWSKDITFNQFHENTIKLFY